MRRALLSLRPRERSRVGVPAGAGSRLTTKVLRLPIDLPMVIWIVDRPEKIAAIMPFRDETVHGGLVTIEDLRVVHYRGSTPAPGAGQPDGAFSDRGPDLEKRRCRNV